MKIASVLGLAFAAAGCLDIDQEFTLNPDDSGKVDIRQIAPPMNFDLTERKAGAKSDPPAQKPTDEEIKAKIKEERAKYQQMKPLMESFLKDLRYHSKVYLPGTVAETNNFKKVSATSVELAFEGKALMKI